MRSNNRTNLQDKTSSRAVNSKVIKSSNRKPEASNSSNISSKTIPQNNSNEPKGSRINSDSNRNSSNKPGNSRINNTSNGNSKTIPQDNRNESKGNRINSASNRSNKPGGNSNNTTTGLHNNAIPLKHINNRSPGRGIALTTGSLITEHGNNGAAIVATVFLTPVSAPPMARHTDSAFIVFQ